MSQTQSITGLSPSSMKSITNKANISPENKIRNTLDLLLTGILFLALCLFSHIPRSALSIRSLFTQDIPPAESPQLMLAV